MRLRKPNFSEEKKLWRRGYLHVAGVDEVGRGCFAGPVVAAAVVFPKPDKRGTSKKIGELGINDSKLLRPRQREKLAEEIKKQALGWDVTEIGVSTINRLGIGKATQKAMRKSISDLEKKLQEKHASQKETRCSLIDYVLVDAFYVRYLKGLPAGRQIRGSKARDGRQKAIINGDSRSISIAAASILAKVYRDQLMRRLSKKYPQYEWGKNKGYGTKLHQKAIKRYGLTRFHRKQFVKTWREKHTS